MAFDKNLDKELWGETVEFGDGDGVKTTRLRVSVFSYNDGEPKLQISRENLNPNSGEWTFAKLGRMFKDQVEAVLPLMAKAKEHMVPKNKEE